MVTYVKNFGLIGLAIGGIFFILALVGLDIPVVIGTTTYKGIKGGLILLVGITVLLLIIGFVVSLFSSGKQTY